MTITVEHTDIKKIASIVASVREGFESNVSMSLDYRKEQLRALRRCLDENRLQVRSFRVISPIDCHIS
jgi:hypothetical protein